MPPEQVPSPIILIISGPAGSGKTTLCDRLLDEFHGQVKRIVTTTTRSPRPGEVDGIDYHFLSRDSFQTRIREGAFIEWAEVHGRYYGSQRKHILGLLETGTDLLLNIDVQGARAFRHDPSINSALPGCIHTVFIKPESIEQIRDRLQNRASDSGEEIERRLNTAALEIKAAQDFDHVIISGSREADYAALRKLYLTLRK